jgi:hypothetical protein
MLQTRPRSAWPKTTQGRSLLLAQTVSL